MADLATTLVALNTAAMVVVDDDDNGEGASGDCGGDGAATAATAPPQLDNDTIETLFLSLTSLGMATFPALLYFERVHGTIGITGTGDMAVVMVVAVADDPDAGNMAPVHDEVQVPTSSALASVMPELPAGALRLPPDGRPSKAVPDEDMPVEMRLVPVAVIVGAREYDAESAEEAPTIISMVRRVRRIMTNDGWRRVVVLSIDLRGVRLHRSELGTEPMALWCRPADAKVRIENPKAMIFTCVAVWPPPEEEDVREHKHEDDEDDATTGTAAASVAASVATPAVSSTAEGGE